jgi:hypothetical protein
LGVDTNEKQKVEPFRKPVVIQMSEIATSIDAADRRYKHTIRHVGPVRSGSLREFEDEEPTR